LADAGRVFARRPAVGDASRMPRVHARRIADSKTDRAAVAGRSRRTVDRLRYGENARRRTVEDPTLLVDDAGRYPDGAEHGVVKLLRCGDVIGTDHHVTEHLSLLFVDSAVREMPDCATRARPLVFIAQGTFIR